MNAYPKLLKRKLFSMIHQMARSPEAFVKSPGQDFTRKRKLDFETLFKLVLGMNGNTLRKEIYEHFDYDSSSVSTSAFCQQRTKIKDDAFQYLFNGFNKATGKIKLYKGYRLLAVDGSALNIHHDPSNKDTYIRHTGSGKGYNALHLNALYDIQNRCYSDALVQPEKFMNECQAFCDMVDRSSITDNVIVIGDRGYESYNDFAHTEEKGWKYLIRVKDLTSNGITRGLNLPDTDEFDTTITLQLSQLKSKEVKANLPNYKFMPKTSRFDYLPELSSHYTITFRVLRTKISEGNYFMAITNLDDSEVSIREIKELYKLRWSIETSFRELKYTLGLTAFHSKKVAFILQEIYARLIMYNFCEMIITNIIIEKKETKHTYQVNFTAAIDICKRFYRTKKYKQPPDVEALILRNTLPIRYGRKFPHFVRRGRSVSFNYRVA